MVAVSAFACLPTERADVAPDDVVEPEGVDDPKPAAPSNGSCFWETSPSFPNAERHCCIHPKSVLRVSCGPWKCLKGFNDCNGNLATAGGDGCECGPCSAGCFGATCDGTYAITKKQANSATISLRKAARNAREP